MITATFFGEITELDSRAVWYSDEEDDDDEENDELRIKTTPKVNPIEPISHETFRSNVVLNFRRISTDLKLNFSSCVISLSSSSQFKNLKLADASSLPLLGVFDTVGKAFAYPVGKAKDQQQTPQQQAGGGGGGGEEYLLWLLFDSTHPHIAGHEVGYFVESLREVLQSEFNLDHANQILILSQQFSSSEHLEYLSNFRTPTTKDLPFFGQPILPPSLIKNQFESALFEQLTLSLKPAHVLCLPNPKNFWFDKTKNWPSVPNPIVELKLNDDNLEKTLIFT